MASALISVSGDSQHHLDRRVHRPEPEGADRELHQRLLVY